MMPRPTRSTRTVTLVPYTTLFRSNWLQRSFSDSFSPGASSPSTIIWRRRSASSLCSGRRWIGAATSMLMGVQAFLVHCAVGGLAEQPCDMHRLATRALADLVAAGGAVGNDARLGTGRAHPRQDRKSDVMGKSVSGRVATGWRRI